MDEPTPPAADGPEPEHHWDPSDRRLSPGATAFLGLGISMALCVAVLLPPFQRLNAH